MIVTHTQTATGERRIYLGGKSSLECYLIPDAEGSGWSFHLEDAVTGQQLSDADRKDWAIYMLIELARELDVAPADLAAVPFEAIAALHTADPYASRRVAMPRRRSLDNGYMATPPHITRPKADYTAADFHHRRSR